MEYKVEALYCLSSELVHIPAMGIQTTSVHCLHLENENKTHREN